MPTNRADVRKCAHTQPIADFHAIPIDLRIKLNDDLFSFFYFVAAAATTGYDFNLRQLDNAFVLFFEKLHVLLFSSVLFLYVEKHFSGNDYKLYCVCSKNFLYLEM